MTADEMFEKLGYKKIKEDDIEIIYKQSETIYGEKFIFLCGILLEYTCT